MGAGNYEMFSGRDATLNLGLNSLEAGLPGPDAKSVADMSIGERCALEGWVQRYKDKYPIVARLDESAYPFSEMAPQAKL